jgi:hypothetical protein
MHATFMYIVLADARPLSKDADHCVDLKLHFVDARNLPVHVICRRATALKNRWIDLKYNYQLCVCAYPYLQMVLVDRFQKITAHDLKTNYLSMHKTYL